MDLVSKDIWATWVYFLVFDIGNTSLSNTFVYDTTKVIVKGWRMKRNSFKNQPMNFYDLLFVKQTKKKTREKVENIYSVIATDIFYGCCLRLLDKREELAINVTKLLYFYVLTLAHNPTCETLLKLYPEIKRRI